MTVYLVTFWRNNKKLLSFPLFWSFWIHTQVEQCMKRMSHVSSKWPKKKKNYKKSSDYFLFSILLWEIESFKWAHINIPTNNFSRSIKSHLQNIVRLLPLLNGKYTEEEEKKKINLPNAFGKLNIKITNYIIAIMIKIIINGS